MEYRNVTLMTALERPIGTLESGRYVQCRPDKETVVLVGPTGRRHYLDSGQYGRADIRDDGPASGLCESTDTWLRSNPAAQAVKGLEGYSLKTDQEDSTS